MKKIIFIYNADSGFFSQLVDGAHKVLSPKTYSCDLCKLTHGSVGIKKEWKEFLEDLPFELEFLHRNELKKVPELQNLDLPLIALQDGSGTKLVLSAEETGKINDLQTLKKTLMNKINLD